MAPHLPGTILVIDDEPSVIRALTGLLRRDGYHVGTASNGRHAMVQLQEQPYDVIVCDLHMPDLDGPAFYALLTCEAAPEKFESKRFCSAQRIHGSCTPVHFCSSFSWRPPLCGPSHSTFPIRLSPLWIPSSSRPRRPVSSAVPKPCARSSKGTASKRCPTRCTLPIPRCASGSIALPTKEFTAWWIAPAPGAHPKGPARWRTTPIGSPAHTH